ncbi:MAG: ABC transporter ATP-binding protein, partial [Pseudomonadota bacterium]
MIALYQAIWRASGRQQIVLIVLSILVAGLAAVPLEYQKTIINLLTAAGEDLQAERRELYRLAAEMFALILFSLALKWALGYRSSIVGESTILLVRKRATGNFLDPEQRDTMRDERGTQAALLSAEVEEVGKFAGSAIAEPLMQLGTLVAVIGYITLDQPALGLIALLVVLPQVVVVVTTQRRINRLVADRV